MVHYTIEPHPKSRDLTTIVTEFGNCRYNRVSMGIYASSEKIKAKVDELLGDIKGVNKYFDNILVLGKGILSQHIYQLRVIFASLSASGLQFNATKCSFGLNGIPYLVYIVTQKMIKPDLKKVQGIMDIMRRTKTTEVYVLISMVQYYREMCIRKSHVLDPMTEVASGPKGR